MGAIKKLSKVLHDFGAVTTFVDDENQLAIDQAGTEELHARLTGVEFEEHMEQREGVLLGLFPERAQYEFKPAEGASVFYGPVSDRLDTRYLADPEFARSILLKPIVATFEVNAITHRRGIKREERILQDVRLLQTSLSGTAR